MFLAPMLISLQWRHQQLRNYMMFFPGILLSTLASATRKLGVSLKRCSFLFSVVACRYSNPIRNREIQLLLESTEASTPRLGGQSRRDFPSYNVKTFLQNFPLSHRLKVQCHPFTAFFGTRFAKDVKMTCLHWIDFCKSCQQKVSSC